MFKRIMAMDISDEAQYQRYREEMTPILKRYGGSFAYDFKVSDVLISKTPDAINRVFMIEFPSEQVMDDFFSCEEYLKVKTEFLDSSVASRTILAMFDES